MLLSQYHTFQSNALYAYASLNIPLQVFCWPHRQCHILIHTYLQKCHCQFSSCSCWWLQYVPENLEFCETRFLQHSKWTCFTGCLSEEETCSKASEATVNELLSELINAHSTTNRILEEHIKQPSNFNKQTGVIEKSANLEVFSTSRNTEKMVESLRVWHVGVWVGSDRIAILRIVTIRKNQDVAFQTKEDWSFSHAYWVFFYSWKIFRKA